jgi:predicted dehydrogenase
MNIAIVGCGYVASMYAKTLPHHPCVKLVGAYDSDPARADSFVARWPARRYSDLDELLADRRVETVLNLTNPRAHFEITRRCLERGKHVYSEKPLAMSTADAEALVRTAEAHRVHLCSAPCSVLSETAQTLWHAIRSSAIGQVRLVYANFDDGMIAPNQEPWNWREERGVPWPAKDEFEVGCTYEHAGYLLTWLCAFFGPARRVTAFASCQLPDKGIAVEAMAPDFTVGSIEFDAGVVARVTCSLVAPRDKSLTVVGDKGVAFVTDVRNDRAPVFVRSSNGNRIEAAVHRRLRPITRRLEQRVPVAVLDRLTARRYRPVKSAAAAAVALDKPVDFLLGVSELAEAIAAGRAPYLSPLLGTHLVEIIEALQFPERFGFRKVMTTTFPPMTPRA